MGARRSTEFPKPGSAASWPSLYQVGKLQKIVVKINMPNLHGTSWCDPN